MVLSGAETGQRSRLVLQNADVTDAMIAIYAFTFL
jgi:hypothetical protein